MKNVIIATLITLSLVGCKDKEPPLPSASIKVELKDGLGSGTKIGERLILTAAHVVGDNQTVKIKNEEGAVVDGRVLFVDKTHDLAVVEADVYAKIAKVKCAIVKPGTEFYMYGNPVNREFVYSWGRISSAPRKFPVAESAYIVDATIISGNSGGGAFDKYGKMIGAVIAIQTIDISENSPMEALSITGFGFVVDGPTICNFLDKNGLTYRH